MSYYVYNGDNKVVTRFDTEKEAFLHAQVALKFSKSLMIFVYSEKDLENLDLSDCKKRNFTK